VYICLMYNRSETYTVYHSKLACPPVNLRSMMLFVCPDLSPSCLFHCHHRGVDKFVRLWGWDVEYCCTLYFQGRLSKYLHNYMHLRTPLPFVYTLAPSLGSEFSSTESRAEGTTPPLVFGFASHESTADKYVWCSPTWAGIQLSQSWSK